MPFGNPILQGSVLARVAIKSEDFVAGVSGWAIFRDGSAEFNNVTVRGEVWVNGPDGSYIRIFNNGSVPQINMQPAAFTDPGPASAGQSGSITFADAVNLGAASFARARILSPEFTGPGLTGAELRLSGESLDSSIPATAALIASVVELNTSSARVLGGTLDVDGLINGGYTYVETVVITGTGNFLKANYPTGKLARVRLCGGGGGGGGADVTGAAQWAFGDGGGGAEAGFIDVPFSSMAGSEVVTVGTGGAGGAGAAPGVTGNPSSFGAFITCNGGGGAATRPANTTVGAFSTSNTRQGGFGGAGGTRWRGQTGGSGQGFGTAVTQVRGGDGGASSFSGAMPGALANNAGTAGASFGGGGSGAANSVSQAARTGGAGTGGIVIVEIYG